MPALIAAPWLGTAIAGIAGGTAAVVGAKMSSGASSDAARTQSDAATRAAQLQTDAATKAAQIQSDSAAKTLAFQEKQAKIDQQNAEVARKANYQQWLSDAGAKNSLRGMLGLGQVSIPDYVPGVVGDFGTGSNQTGAGTNQGTAEGPAQASGPVDGSAASISAYFKSNGVSDHETPYWVSKWPELVARGKEIGDPNYAMKRLAASDVFGGSAPVAQAPAKAPAATTLNTLATGGYGNGAVMAPRLVAPTASVAPPVWAPAPRRSLVGMLG